MKRIFSFLMIFVLAFSMAAFAEEEFSPVGKWYSTALQMVVEEEPVMRDSLFMGFSSMLSLKEDGDGYFYLNRYSMMAESFVEWEYADNVVKLTLESGDVIEMQVVDGQLVQQSDEDQYVYYSNDVPLAPEPAPMIADAALEDFEGTWKVVSASQYGFALDLDYVGVSGMEFTYKGKDTAKITFPTYETAAEESEPLEYNGAAIENGEATFGDGLITATLHEDGTMIIELRMSMGMVKFTMEK